MTNSYDKENIVDRVSLMLAGGIKFASYRVRRPAGEEWSDLQFHMTYMPQSEIGGRTMVDDGGVVVCAMMPEAVARRFIQFVADTENADDLLDPMDQTGSYDGNTEFICSKRSEGGIEYQVRHHDMVLGVMGKSMAKLFATMCKNQLAIKELPQ